MRNEQTQPDNLIFGGMKYGGLFATNGSFSRIRDTLYNDTTDLQYRYGFNGMERDDEVNSALIIDYNISTNANNVYERDASDDLVKNVVVNYLRENGLDKKVKIQRVTVGVTHINERPIQSPTPLSI
ncbi:hypothetical protein GC194_15220 [bacterium]|nr:hypothetical protein [bacterium]